MDSLARCCLLACLLAGPLVSATALAQGYPTKPVRIIVTFPPGLELVAPAGATPEQFAAFIRNERETFEKVVELTGIRE